MPFLSTLLLIILILANSPVSVKSASTITVTNTNESGTGSLRQAIADATSGDTIDFSTTGTINLSGDDLEIEKDLTINGPGAGVLTVDGNYNYAVFRTTPGHTVTISGLTIREGRSGIYNYQSTLYVNDCVFTENGSDTGGGIRTNGGSLFVTNSDFINNSNTTSSGPGIFVDLGYASIIDSDFIGNTTYGVGAAIYFREGTLDIDGCTFDNNTSTEYYGAALCIGEDTVAVTVNNSTFTGNESNTHGGAIYLHGGTTTITNSTISGNTAGERGGGIYTDDAPVTIENCTISDNDAGTDGGAIFAFEDLTIEDSTINNNTAGQHGGAILITKPMVVTNSTISGNTADVDGGGIFISPPGLVTLNHVTLTGNTADGDSNESGDGGGVYVQYSQSEVQFRNSIVAGNIDNSDTGNSDCYVTSGVVTSLDYNLTGIGTGCSLGGTHDQTTAEAQLLPLGDNGGDTETHALDTGSPAINQIPSGTNGCGGTYVTDQRGINRPQGTNCDIGAFEHEISIDNDIIGMYSRGQKTSYLKGANNDV